MCMPKRQIRSIRSDTPWCSAVVFRYRSVCKVLWTSHRHDHDQDHPSQLHIAISTPNLQLAWGFTKMGVSDCRERAYKAHSSKMSRLSASRRRRHGRRRAAVEGRLFLAQTFDSHASMGFVVVDSNGNAAQEPGWESRRADHASHVGPLMLAPWGDVGPGPRRRCLLIELSRCMGNMGNAPRYRVVL